MCLLFAANTTNTIGYDTALIRKISGSNAFTIRVYNWPSISFLNFPSLDCTSLNTSFTPVKGFAANT
ncbi:hypothetical protein OCD89_13480 [Bacillus toyonensis]|nr:hypothetical protein [Bacillus toyonensis]